MLHPIYIMAIVTTLLALLTVGGFLRWKSPPGERSFLLLLLLVELPMCALAFYLVRMPLLDVAVQHIVDSKSALYPFLRTFYAPLTEEPAKIWVLLFPAVRRRITRENFWRAALALGLGFGIGELWFLAYYVSDAPQLANIPWYQFTGFLNERLMVCINHGAFVGITLFFFTRRQFLLGFALAMLFHYLGNFPLYLAQINFANFGPQAWSILVALWVPTSFLAALLLLAYFAMGTTPGAPSGLRGLGAFFHGKSICPECHAEYPAPLLGLNLLTQRFERCPNCKKWHLVSRIPKAPPPP